MANQALGLAGENAALNYLRQQGLKLVARNFRSKQGEIDLIMIDRSTVQDAILVFTEVRYRSSRAYGGAEASVTRQKQQRIIKTAHTFRRLHQRYISWPCRFDVVAVHGSTTRLQCEWLKAAFHIV